MKRSVATRAVGQGLAKVEPTSPNVLIAYSAKAGSTAADGDGKNSPFTTALANHLTTPGLDVRRAFGFVRDEVLKTTGNRQEPFVYGSLGGEDVPLVPAPVRAAPAAAAPATPALSAQAEVRRDYELAMQVGNKSALNAFLAQYPDGFYASLAKLQLEKITAEETRVVATEKARQTEQERARLAAEGAQKTQQAKADADAKAAEQARIAAEKAKQVAQDQAAAAEQKRAAAEKAAADKAAADKVLADKAAADKAAAPAADKDKSVNLAALSAGAPQADVTKSVQAELRRVGCLTGAADGDWNSGSQRSLTQFNRYAGTKLDAKLASVDTLDAIKQKTTRVCPLVCEHGFKADGDRCSKISCAEGSFLNDDNECEKRREKKPVAKRDTDGRRDRERAVREQPEPRRVIVRRSPEPGYPGAASSAAGVGASGRPLTGQERAVGCNGYGNIMSGVCP
jgi:hypothetical protein